jgi:propionyl-CoA carboxylase alpha chain
MPGTVLRVEVAAGDPVAADRPIVVLEAMKMEHQITAPTPGIVTALNVTRGQQVEAGAVLAVIEKQSPEGPAAAERDGGAESARGNPEGAVGGR